MVLENRPGSTRPKARKFAGSLAALSAAAVVSIYTVGYASTASSIDDLTAQLPPAVTTSVPVSTSTPTARVVSSAPLPAATAVTSKAGKYVDGSYTGSGTSRHGGITATVVVSGGKIVSASVTTCGTRYPCSDVDPLVKAVVTNQSVPTTNVSGATDSSNAYKTAVASAIQKALAGA